ncbi:MAG: RNA methyltransferase [Planctomycetes bacterium]|nr:RNA methyltransferase [Planctomycetota bacterium]
MQEIRIVLVEPKEAGNVGAAARAMRNAGLTDLVVVRPRYGRDDEMWRLGVKAESILAAMRVAGSIDEALDGATGVAGTTDHPVPDRDRIVTPRALAAHLPELGPRVALLFGREDEGLRREELERCRYVSRIPANVEQPVLNLAQAVLVHLYEIRLAGGTAPPSPAHLPSAEEERRRLLEHARRWLDGIDYKEPFQRERVYRLFRGLLASNPLRPRDLSVLHTIVRWAELGRRFPARGPSEDSGPLQAELHREPDQDESSQEFGAAADPRADPPP